MDCITLEWLSKAGVAYLRLEGSSETGFRLSQPGTDYIRLEWIIWGWHGLSEPAMQCLNAEYYLLLIHCIIWDQNILSVICHILSSLYWKERRNEISCFHGFKMDEMWKFLSQNGIHAHLINITLWEMFLIHNLVSTCVKHVFILESVSQRQAWQISVSFLIDMEWPCDVLL